MAELKSIIIDGENFFYSLSFDIDDFIGDGIWWLQIYNYNKKLIYDKPFASSMGKIGKQEIIEIIKQEFLACRGEVIL